MKALNVLKNDYFRLFVKRESRVVLGKNYSTLWLLTAVLTATFLAIAFSNASLEYLSYKMDDPFINWVDITRSYEDGEDVNGLVEALAEDSNREKFHYHSFQTDHSITRMFYNASLDDSYLIKMRFLKHMNIPLVDAILSEENIVDGCTIGGATEDLNNSIGVIITSECLAKLGYTTYPSYLYVQWGGCYDAEEFGFDVYDGKFVSVPVPVLAVVKRLPGNVDIVASSYLYMQTITDTKPFNLEKADYASDLRYFVPSKIDIDEFVADLEDIAREFTDEPLMIDSRSFYMPEIKPFKKGKFIVASSGDDVLDYSTLKAINDKLLSKYKNDDVHRIFEYKFSDHLLSSGQFISIHFNDLDMLGEFEQYTSTEYKVKIEMSQINAKQNFNAVSTMGNILSWAIIVFAIIAIILFIVNLLQSYFHKVKRNLGTFKAFGISNKDLISVYVLILAVIIVAAIVLSISVTWFIQGSLQICGILKDGTFAYLSLWSFKTVCSIAVIIMASLYTVSAVMQKLLKATPGDLIYDRQ